MKKAILVLDLGDNSKDSLDLDFVNFCNELEQKFDKLLLVRDQNILLKTALINTCGDPSFSKWIFNLSDAETPKEASVVTTFLFNCKGKAEVQAVSGVRYVLKEMAGVSQFYSRGEEMIDGFKKIFTPSEIQM